MSVEELSKQVQELSAVVEKQSKLIAQTGKQLIELQVRDVKSKINEADLRPDIDTSDFVTNEDIVQLVGELQSQLDALEDRSIARIYNSKLADETSDLEPLTNKDGDLPPDDLFPKNLKEFKSLDKYQVVRLSEFYEILVGAQDEEAILSGKESNTLDERVAAVSDEQSADLRVGLARYLGI